MSLDAATKNSGQSFSTDNSQESDDQYLGDLETEHIYIGDEFAERSGSPTTVRKRSYLRNHVRSTITEFTYYEEGFLKIREGNKKKLGKEHVLELRFIDPTPITKRRIAMPWFWTALPFGAMALFCPTVLSDTQFSPYAMTGSLVLGAIAALMAYRFIYRSEVTHEFRTASGKASVVSLTGSLGCFRRARVISNETRKAIEAASEDSGTHDIQYLRAEMQAHYKLAETGVITREACSDGTALILSKFG